MPKTTVLCLPPAGAGPSFFHDWRGPTADVHVQPVELPGREKRFGEPEPRDMAELLAVVVPEVLPAVRAADRVVVLGHSFGAILAFELCHALSAAAPGSAVTLVASGSTRPGVARGGRITGLPDEEFIAGVEAIAGYRHPALGEPELREVLLPPLRADVAMHENHHVPPDAPKLDVPVLAVRGSDDTIVAPAQADEWRQVTTGPFRSVEVEGGHMYLVEAWPRLLHVVAECLDDLESPHVPPAPGPQRHQEQFG